MLTITKLGVRPLLHAFSDCYLWHLPVGGDSFSIGRARIPEFCAVSHPYRGQPGRCSGGMAGLYW